MPRSVSWEITIQRRDGTQLPPRVEVRPGPPLRGQKIQVKDEQGNLIVAEIAQYTVQPPRGSGPGPFQVIVRETD